MVYWLAESITSSTRLYHENDGNLRPRRRNESDAMGWRERPDVPTGVALFPGEIVLPPRKWVEAQYNVVHWTEMPTGGHFAALEEPGQLVKDIRAFVGKLR